MLIGCLFTLAGFILSSLFNTPTQAQNDNVIDEIVCKKLKIVNDDGQRVVGIGSTVSKSGVIETYNGDGRKLVGIGTRDDGSGVMETHNADGKGVVSIGASVLGNGELRLHNYEGKGLVYIGAVLGDYGIISTGNADGKELVGIGGSVDGKSGHLSISNTDGKELVGIGSREFGGILQIYNKEGIRTAVLASSTLGGSRLKIYSGIKEGNVYLDGLGVFVRNVDANTVATLGSHGLSIYNTDGQKIEKEGEDIVIKNRLVHIGSVNDKSGVMETYNADGKELVYIGAIEGRRNDGLINIHNHKGEWRSYKGD